jgi:hypothetical protein
VTLEVPLDLRPMEANPVSMLPAAGWDELKYDGLRFIAFRDGADIHLRGHAIERPWIHAKRNRLGTPRISAPSQLNLFGSMKRKPLICLGMAPVPNRVYLNWDMPLGATRGRNFT